MHCNVHVYYIFRLRRPNVIANNQLEAIKNAVDELRPYAFAKHVSDQSVLKDYNADQLEYAEEISHYLVDRIAPVTGKILGSNWYVDSPQGAIPVVDGRHEAAIVVEIKDGLATIYSNRPDVCVHVINHDSLNHVSVGLGSNKIRWDPKLEKVKEFIEKYGDYDTESSVDP